jgi:hypothetical protein
MRVLLACLASLTALASAQPLPGTQPWRLEGDPAAQMVEGIHRYLDRATAAAAARRSAPDRARLRKITGAVDARGSPITMKLDAAYGESSVVARGAGFRVHAVRWPVMGSVEGEGLLLDPEHAPIARVVALPDADWTPEMLAGLAPGLPPEAQFARRLAETGCLVIVPALVDRRDEHSTNPRIGRWTNQPHREFIYRMAYEAGRHIIGYEAQKVLAAVDWFATLQSRAPIAVAGYGEGGLIALAAAALDERIQAALVSGYFGSGENLWEAPIYRNVWRWLSDFGDAGVAGLIAPRALIIEAAPAPQVSGPPPATKTRRGAAPGRIAATLRASRCARPPAPHRERPACRNRGRSRSVAGVARDNCATGETSPSVRRRKSQPRSGSAPATPVRATGRVHPGRGARFRSGPTRVLGKGGRVFARGLAAKHRMVSPVFLGRSDRTAARSLRAAPGLHPAHLRRAALDGL